GIGFHDASWQASFGGQRYRTHGSHGCVNLPTSVAGQLYELLMDGMPVICHY
ncbi:MAG: L,D-transpeptidase, partial [Lachnospiraceae bacterium]|nr:L,D-transpeptidase [Lachnospiraceae bacterium]